MTYFVAVGPLVLVLLSIELGQSAPLFVNEYVHIKGHVSKLTVQTSPRHNYIRGHGPHVAGWHNPDQSNHLHWRRRPLMKTRPQIEWDRLLALDARKQLTMPKKQVHSNSQPGQPITVSGSQEAAYETTSQNMLKSHNKNAGFHYDALPFHTHHFKNETQKSDNAQEYVSNRQSNYRRRLRAKRFKSEAAQPSAHDDEYQLGAHDSDNKEPAFIPDAMTHTHIADGMTQPDEEFALPKHEPVYPPFNDNSFQTSDREWPEAENSRAAETYIGIDSYSAEHVQGLGSGVYQYPIPFLYRFFMPS